MFNKLPKVKQKPLYTIALYITPMATTTMQVSKDLLQDLKSRKMYDKESYEDIIRDLLEDTQLQSRGYFSFLEHPEMGVTLYQEASFKLSGTSSKMWRAPCIGEHTEFVCCQLLGMSDSEFIELMDKGIFD